MGNQCCQEETRVGKSYQNQKDLRIETPSKRYPTRISASSGSKNFAQVSPYKQTQLHPKVSHLKNTLSTFKPSSQLVIPKGEQQVTTYALNNDGLDYLEGSQWKDGVPHGKGTLIYPDGSEYQGYFIKGVPNGEGRFISSTGWYYQGELVNQQAEGLGVFIFDDLGYKYEGNWEGDLPNGRGKQTWIDDGVFENYDGQFMAGKKHGFGKYKHADLWTYEGDFSNNQMTSPKGKLTYKNGQFYQGYFHDGKKHGFGYYEWPDGSVYEGWYNNDIKDGHGKFKSADEKVFQGQWKNGKRQGKGTLYVDGKKYGGQWKNDKPIAVRNF